MGGNRSDRTRIRVRLNFLAFPVQSSLGVLGRKWGLLVLMNIALGRAERFNELLRASHGMSKRILAMRLRELETHGYIARAEQRQAYVRWRLTPKGGDVLPVLLTLIHFASKWREPGTNHEDPLLLGPGEFEILVQGASDFANGTGARTHSGGERRRRSDEPAKNRSREV